MPVLDGGGRGATTTFAQRNLGDALVTFESEVPLIQKRVRRRTSRSSIRACTILAENPVSVVDKVVDKSRHPQAEAEAYLQFLWSDEAARKMAAKHHLRPRQREGAGEATPRTSRRSSVFTSYDDVFGGWATAQKEHFNDGATV